MARFIVNSIDYDQFGGGVFTAVEELQRQLPITAELWRRIPGPDRPDYFLAGLEQRINYHPIDGFDWARCQPEFLARDDSGPFVWVYAVIVASLIEGTQLHAGMQEFPVRLAYVIDNTVGHDAQLEFAKCDYICYAMISDLACQPVEPPADPPA
ncbi:hypothetical protein [Mycobacterium kansasii]|uniref:hypothetical protein n=1 Tax=Mycobacterium kansasii TaxID=1768 RepID=UPI000F0274BE|nr:hypothetical protein [Mycobacterium kansasii]VAZ61075.1 hypothetical protein LAUMK22_02884 [Mycobacterium kansasii]